MSKLHAAIGKAYEMLDERRQRALAYAASKLDTTTNDDRFLNPEILAGRVERVEAAIAEARENDEEATSTLEDYAAVLAVAADATDPRIDAWLGEEPSPLSAAVNAVRDHLSDHSEDLLALTPRPYLDVLHPLTLLEWAKLLIAHKRQEDASDVVEALLRRAPSHAEVYALAAELRALEGDEYGEARTRAISDILAGEGARRPAAKQRKRRRPTAAAMPSG